MAIAEVVVWNTALTVPTPLLALDSMLLPKRRLGQADGLQIFRQRVADARQRPFRSRAAASDTLARNTTDDLMFCERAGTDGRARETRLPPVGKERQT
jgi:hypothetical protein